MYGYAADAFRAAAQDLTASEAPLIRSQTPPGNHPPSGTDASLSTAPHSVPGDSPAGWTAALARVWRSVFPRDAFAHPAHTDDPGPGGRQFFPRRGRRAAGDPPRD